MRPASRRRTNRSASAARNAILSPAGRLPFAYYEHGTRRDWLFEKSFTTACFPSRTTTIFPFRKKTKKWDFFH
jgi:hypothetical protein